MSTDSGEDLEELASAAIAEASTFEYQLARAMKLEKELAEAREELQLILNEVQHYQPGGSPPPGGPLMLTAWVLRSLYDGEPPAFPPARAAPLRDPLGDALRGWKHCPWCGAELEDARCSCLRWKDLAARCDAYDRAAPGSATYTAVVADQGTAGSTGLDWRAVNLISEHASARGYAEGVARYLHDLIARKQYQPVAGFRDRRCTGCGAREGAPCELAVCDVAAALHKSPLLAAPEARREKLRAFHEKEIRRKIEGGSDYCFMGSREGQPMAFGYRVLGRLVIVHGVMLSETSEPAPPNVEADPVAPVRALLATWQRNRKDPRYGTGAPGPLYVAGMAAEADAMIAGLERALVGECETEPGDG